MTAWLRLTWLFGLPENQPPEDLMIAALGPVLRASQSRLAEAPLPPRIQALLLELARQESAEAAPDVTALEPLVLAADTLRKAALGEVALRCE
jgi:hypothetical protein